MEDYLNDSSEWFLPAIQDAVMVNSVNAEQVSVAAVYISAPSQELLVEARNACKEWLPRMWTLPCGNGFSAATVEDIPLESVPCPCGDPAHWLVKVSISQPLKFGVEHDDRS